MQARLLLPAVFLIACTDSAPRTETPQPLPTREAQPANPAAATTDKAAPPQPTTTPPQPTTTPPPQPTTATPAQAKATPPAPTKAAANTLLSIDAEFDGHPGADPIVLHKDGTLLAGTLRGKAKVTSTSDYWLKEQAAIRVVDFDRKRKTRAIVVALPQGGIDEDPPNLYQVFVAEGPKLRRVLNRVIGSYGVNPLRFPGDKTARYLEDGWGACTRKARKAGKDSVPFTQGVVDRHEVILRLDKTGMLTESARKPSGKKQDCSMLAG